MEPTKENEAFERGVELFNGRQFFEAHEVWEEIWLRAPEPEKTLLQGFIQIAAALHHWQRANASGAKSLLSAGIAKLETCPAGFHGIDAANLRAEARGCLTAFGTRDEPGLSELPKIQKLRG